MQTVKGLLVARSLGEGGRDEEAEHRILRAVKLFCVIIIMVITCH